MMARSAHAVRVWHCPFFPSLWFYSIINPFQPHPFSSFVRGDSAGPNPVGCSAHCAVLCPRAKQPALTSAAREQWTDRGFLLA